MNTGDRAPFPSGIISAVATPMHADLSVDIPALVAHCGALLDNGADGIVLLGTTGEANAFSVDERKDLLGAVISEGIPAGVVMAGTGCCALPDTIALTRHAVELGIRHLLMLPPFYYKNVSDDGLIAAYSYIIDADRSDALRVYVYDFPQMTGVRISLHTLKNLHEKYPEIIAGIKYSGGSRDHLMQIITEIPRLQCYAGSEDYLADMLNIGGAGCISATANITAPVARQLIDAWREDSNSVLTIQQKLSEVRKIFDGIPLVSGVKSALAYLSGNPGWEYMRPPNMPLDPERAGALSTALKKHGYAPATQ